MMRLAISNIAWPPEDSDAVYGLLAQVGVHGLEIAPGLLFASEPDPFAPSERSVRLERSRLDAAGLSLVSMQSLLFGVEGAALFGDAEASAAFDRGLRRAIDLAGRLGVPNLVVGSPRNRIIPDGMEASVAWERAVETFRRLGDHAATRDCSLAIEPNPAVYGTNFLNTVAEADRFVRATAHPAMTLNFDVGSLLVNGEFDDLDRLLGLTLDRVSHVHVSEPQLAPAPADAGQFAQLIAALRAARWDGWVSIEMLSTGDQSLPTVRRAIETCLAEMEGAS